MTASEQVDKIEVALRDRVEAWEEGRATSPSCSDYVRDAEDVLGVVLGDAARARIADALYDADCGGAGLRTLAMLAHGAVTREVGR